MTALLHVPDISKWQANVDIGKVGPAVILRAHSGRNGGIDPTLKQRQEQARRACTVVGYYLYVVANRDPITQAQEAAAAIGQLRAGEFVAVDLEEGGAQQSARAEAACGELDTRLGGRSWLYSGLAFYQAHLAQVRDRHLWIAAYRRTEPAMAHTLWQHTNGSIPTGRQQPCAHATPGIGRCDCSIFHGTAQDLRDLISPPAPPRPSVRKPPPGTPAWWTHPVELGSREQEVASVAKRLNVPLRVTFDADLDNRVRYVQKQHRLPITGIVDAATAKAIG